jgi:transposase-like protein
LIHFEIGKNIRDINGLTVVEAKVLRNGYSLKSIKTSLGETELDIPRDRNGRFEPQIIKKYENFSFFQ